jgi:hypothetical protein
MILTRQVSSHHSIFEGGLPVNVVLGDAVLNHEALPAAQRRFLVRAASVGGPQP